MQLFLAGALLVYDITDTESFRLVLSRLRAFKSCRRVAKWVEELQVAVRISELLASSKAEGTQCVLAIVGNKSDLQSQVGLCHRAVSKRGPRDESGCRDIRQDILCKEMLAS